MRHIWQPFDVGLDVILATIDNNQTMFFLHDANKNVIQKITMFYMLQDICTYIPFGNVINFSNMHIAFSSEFYEPNTMLFYYNYRYYDSVFGRWNKRDSIEENGGLNLYGFAHNAPVIRYDALGEIIKEYKMDKCEIVIFYGHNYFTDSQHGIQRLNVIPAKCSYYTLLGCATSSLKNDSPLPGFNPPDDLIGWYKGQDGSKGLSDYIHDAISAAEKAAKVLQKCPCNCQSIGVKVIRVDKEFPWYWFDPSYEEEKTIK